MSLGRRNFVCSLLAGGTASVCWGQESTVQSSKAASSERTTVASGQRGAVATVHPIASQAAIDAFERGGNAIDAAVAAALMLSVVDGFNSGIGGGCLALIRSANGKVHALDGREKAPALASPQMFYREGKPDPKLSQTGPLAAGVPGHLAAMDRLVRTHGKIDWREALLGAAEVAHQGFELDTNYVRRLQMAASFLRKDPVAAKVLLDEGGQPWKAGHWLRQQDLGRTFEQLAEHGIDWFYHDEFAEAVDRMMRVHDGVMRSSDLADYNCVARQPIEASYRGRRVFGFPPPSSGGIHNAQMLAMLEQFEVSEIFSGSESRGRHLLLEVMKRAMADRAYWLGDSDFANVPRGLLDQGYLRSRAETIDLTAAVAVASHGTPPAADVDLFGRGGHTTHLTTADASGNVVAITQTINTTFGCKLMVPGTGVVLNNEMDDFSLAPGVRNAFGLLGSDANLVAPGKRPLSSMSPTLVLDSTGQPVMTCGAAGGPKIITTVLQNLVRCIDLGERIQDALAAPRTHHQWSPDEAVCEERLDVQVVNELKALGHQIRMVSTAAVSQGIGFENGAITAASDPRVPSSARAI